MSYHLIDYFALFLPIVILLYQLTPHKYRKYLLLLANYVFFYLISGKLVVYIIGATFVTHYIGLWLENVELTESGGAKAVTKKKRQILAFGILVNLGLLIICFFVFYFFEFAFNNSCLTS